MSLCNLQSAICLGLGLGLGSGRVLVKVSSELSRLHMRDFDIARRIYNIAEINKSRNIHIANMNEFRCRS